MTNTRAIVVLAGWLGTATLFVGLGGIRLHPAPFPQILLATLLLTLLAAYRFAAGFRAWLTGLSSLPFLVFHLSRFVGFYFLALYERGELPYEFAVLGGWGDIAVAACAFGLLIAYRGGPPIASGWLQLWNVIGLADIVFVVSTAGRLAVADPGSMAPILSLPLGLLPTFLVPLILFTHIVLGLRWLGARRRPVLRARTQAVGAAGRWLRTSARVPPA